MIPWDLIHYQPQNGCHSNVTLVTVSTIYFLARNSISLIKWIEVYNVNWYITSYSCTLNAEIKTICVTDIFFLEMRIYADTIRTYICLH